MPPLPDLSGLSHAEKDALIAALWQRVHVAEQRLAELEAKLGIPPKTPDNSSLPPSKGQKPNQPDRGDRKGPRRGSLGRKGGGRPLACDPDETVTAKALVCMHCQSSLDDTNQVLHGRYDKIDLPPVPPVVTRVERMKALLLRACVLARRRRTLAASTRRSYLNRLDRDLNAIMVLAPTNRDGQRRRRRYGKIRSHLFTSLEHPDTPPDNNASEQELRPTATYRKVTGGFRSVWGADLFANVRSVIGTAERRGIDALQAVRYVLRGATVLLPG